MWSRQARPAGGLGWSGVVSTGSTSGAARWVGVVSTGSTSGRARPAKEARPAGGSVSSGSARACSSESCCCPSSSSPPRQDRGGGPYRRLHGAARAGPGAPRRARRIAVARHRSRARAAAGARAAAERDRAAAGRRGRAGRRARGGGVLRLAADLGRLHRGLARAGDLVRERPAGTRRQLPRRQGRAADGQVPARPARCGGRAAVAADRPRRRLPDRWLPRRDEHVRQPLRDDR